MHYASSPVVTYFLEKLNAMFLGGCPRIETVARETHFESDFSFI